MFRSLFLSLLFAGYVSVGLPFLVWGAAYLVVRPDSWWGIGWLLGLFIVPSALVGLHTGVSAYAWNHWARLSRFGDTPRGRALIVGAGSGVFGAVPLGFLLTITKLEVGLPMAILASGIYVFVVFTGYVLLWERRARRRYGSDENHP